MGDAEKTAVVQRHEATPRLPPVEIEGALNGRLLLSTKDSRFKGERSICCMRIGLQVTNFTWPNNQGSLGETFGLIAQRAERAGLFSLWVMDHFFQIPGVGPASHQMWKGDEKPYQGKQYQLGRPLNSPSSVQKPHPPILIGGGGERKTLRLVAQYGDACNFSLTILGLDEAQRKLGVLREHCQTIGRPYTDIEKTIIKRIHLTRDGRENSWTPASAIGYFRQLAAMGIDQAIVSLPNVADLEPFDLFATQIIPAVEQIEIAGR